MAARFWVGGTGPWDNSSTANWSATSGGASGASAPTSGDTVTFDSASGTGTCTIASTAAASAVTQNSATVALVLSGNVSWVDLWTFTQGSMDLGGFNLSLDRINSNNTNTRSIAFGAGKINLAINNNNPLNFSNATGFSCTGSRRVDLTYSGATGTRTIIFGNTAGATESNALDIYVTAGTDIIAISAGGAVRDLNFTGFAGTRTNTAFTCYGSLTISSGMTLSAGTGTLSLRATSGTQTITTSGKTLDFPITVNAPGATVQCADALTQGSTRTFTFTAGTLKLKNGVTTTLGTISTSTTAKTLQSTSDGSQATLSQTSGVVTFTNTTIKDIAFTGGATWRAPANLGNIDGGNNTGIDFAPAGEAGSRAAMSLGFSLSL